MDNPTYQQKLDQEGELWGRVAEESARSVPPDWCSHRVLRHNAIMHTRHIDALLSQVRPGMHTLELGCGAGWLTLALAQQGAIARGLDISAPAVAIAEQYYASIKPAVSGRVLYEVADLNAVELPANTYDIIAAKGVLHHLYAVDRLIEQVHAALKPGGLFWVSDTHGSEATSTALIAGALMLVLPTQTSYRQKLGGLLRFRAGAPARIKASIQADNLSPFEGAGREHDWLAMIAERFEIERHSEHPAVTGYLTAQLRLPDRMALPLLRGLYRLDHALVRRGVLKNTGKVLYARKRAV